MVTRDIEARGVRDRRVLAAMREVARERFVAPEQNDVAFEDRPLPIGKGQTISQPFIVAVMAEAAEIAPNDRVLEIGTGSGYGAAVLSRIAATVDGIERHQSLADSARRVLDELGYDNVTVTTGDGSLGRPDGAPYNAIVVTAAAPSVPPALIEQLAVGGRLVIPVGTHPERQQLLRVRRVNSTTVEEDLGPVRFVPLLGRQGWADDPDGAN